MLSQFREIDGGKNTGRQAGHAKTCFLGSWWDALALAEETPIATAHRVEACDV